MAKYRYRIEGGRYGGELVVGETNPGFALHYGELDDQEELIEAVLDADGIGWNNEEVPEDALIDPNQPPGPGVDEYFNMWENDELEHCNGPYSDGGFYAYEVPADGSDDYDYNKEVWEGDAIQVYSREGAYFGNEKPEENIDEYIPVLAFHSSEKGSFSVWFVDTARIEIRVLHPLRSNPFRKTCQMVPRLNHQNSKIWCCHILQQF